MNIIIEGVDGSYKTTVAKKLSKKLGAPVIKGSSFELATGTNEQLFQHFLQLTQLTNAIIDRSIYSNRVYATLYPKYTILTHNQREQIEEKIRDNSIVIYLSANSEIIIDRLEERGDEYITSDKVKDILGMYNTVMTDAVHNNIKVYTFDTGILSSEDIVNQILEIVEIKLDSEGYSCESCGKKIKGSNSFFGKTHCFSCYLKTMTDIFKINKE